MSLLQVFVFEALAVIPTYNELMTVGMHVCVTSCGGYVTEATNISPQKKLWITTVSEALH